MLIVDGVPLNMSDTNNVYVKEYLEWKERFLKEGGKFPIRIRTHLTPQLNATGDREPEREMFVPWVGKSEKNGIPVMWKYTPRAGLKDKGETVGAVLVINSTDMDKAFFYLTKCNMMKKGLMWLENKKVEAESKLAVRGRMVDVDWMLLSDSSPISSDESKIRSIAMALRIPNAGDRDVFSLPEIKDKMIRAIESGEVDRDPLVNISEFMQLCDMPKHTAQRAYIQKAVDMKAIEFDMNQFKVLVNIDGDWRAISRIDVSEWTRKEEVLINILIKDIEARRIIEQVVGEPFMKEKEQPTGVTYEDIKEMKFDILKKNCEEADIPVVGKGRTREVLIKEYAEHLGML